MFGLFKRIFERKKQKETERQPKTKLTRAERKQLNAVLAKVKKRNNGPATAQDTIPYLRMYQDGICQLDEKHFSKTVQYFDINYELSHHDEKLAVLEEWGDFLNFFDPSVLFQFNYVNLQEDAVELSRRFDTVNQSGPDDPIADELKTFLENVYAQGSNDQARLKFCTFTVTADNLRAARMRLNQVEGGVKEHMNRLGCKCEVMDGKDRMRLLHTIFHLDKREQFNFEWKWLPLTGLSTKDFIAPSSFEFRESRYFKMGEKHASVSAIQILASRLDDTMLAELLNLDNSMVVTLHVKAYDQAEAIKVVKQKLSDLDRIKIDEQMKAARSGYDIDILPADLNLYGKAAREILDMLQSKDQRMFLLTFLIMNTADSKSRLKAVLDELKSMTQPKECPIIPLDYQQEDGMVSSLPLGVNKIEIQRIMTTSALAVLIPFRTMEWADQSPEALYCGVNSLTHNMILVDRKGMSNGNAIILGKPGGGKSMVAKTEIEQVKYFTHDDIMICDPESEYSPMVWAMEGQVIRIAPNSTDYINPLDINLESYAPGESPLQLKAEFVLSLCELMLGDKEGLQTIQKSVIDAALQIIYRPFFADPRKENLPILGDLYEALREMNTERADNVADALEIYVKGSLNLFNHQTNVDVNNRVVCYDIRDLGTQLKPAGMFIVQEQVWSRVAANREKGKYTRYYMDEFHVLLQTPQTAAYSVQIWKRFRKYGGLPMGITQNINDLTRNQGTDNILNNTSYIYMLNQSAGDRKDLAAHLNLSPHQLKKVTDSAPGVGLLYCENAIIPIESHIPENTELYKLMTTKPQEVYLRNLTEGKNHEE